MALLHVNFFSEALGMCVACDVILPQRATKQIGMAAAARGDKHPTLWLLHGASDNHTIWQRRTSIERYAAPLGLAVVMPNAHLSSYADMAHGGKYYTYISQELPEKMRAMFPLSDKREDNFIAGLSMGGNGTLQYAAGHPEKFGGAAILSCAPRDLHQLAKDLEDPEFAKVNYRLVNGIRNAGGMEGYLNSPINVWDRLPELIEQDALPPLYFCCGKNDFLYDRYQAFKEYAQKLGLKATFEEFDGFTHEWRFWDMTIQKALTFFGLDPEEALGNPF